MGSSAGHGTNGHAADQINKLKSKALAHGRVLFPLMFFWGICFLLVDTRVVLKSTQFSSTVFFDGSDAKSVSKDCSRSSLRPSISAFLYT